MLSVAFLVLVLRRCRRCPRDLRTLRRAEPARVKEDLRVVQEVLAQPPAQPLRAFLPEALHAEDDFFTCSIKALGSCRARLEHLQVAETEMAVDHDFADACLFRCERRWRFTGDTVSVAARVRVGSAPPAAHSVACLLGSHKS